MTVIFDKVIVYMTKCNEHKRESYYQIAYMNTVFILKYFQS